MALVNQAVGHPRGFANPLFLSLNGSSALHDVVDPSFIVAAVRVDYFNDVDATTASAIPYE